MIAMFQSITPEIFAGSPLEEAYRSSRPTRATSPRWSKSSRRWTRRRSPGRTEDVRAIAAPTLIVIGDSDAVRLEHAVELFRLLGGGVMGDLAGLPRPGSRCSRHDALHPARPGCWTAPTGCAR